MLYWRVNKSFQKKMIYVKKRKIENGRNKKAHWPVTQQSIPFMVSKLPRSYKTTTPKSTYLFQLINMNDKNQARQKGNTPCVIY